MAKEIKEEEEPWENYGDPNLFIPEPKGLQTILKLKNKDPTAFKLWRRAIRAELKNLISQGMFAIESPEKTEKIIPTTLVLKIKNKTNVRRKLGQSKSTYLHTWRRAEFGYKRRHMVSYFKQKDLTNVLSRCFKK